MVRVGLYGEERLTSLILLIRWLLLPFCLLIGSLCFAKAEIVVTDAIDRTVKIASPAKRVLLEAPFYYQGLSLLRRDAADIVVGIGGADNWGISEYELDLADKPRLGWAGSGTFSIEKALSLKPDLLIATAPRRSQSAAIETAFVNAGIPVVYVDFFNDPARNTVPSIEVIGRAIGSEDKAAEFAEFYLSHVKRIADRISSANTKLQKLAINLRGPGRDCCWSYAKGSVTAYFDMLNVENIASGKIPGGFGQLNPEYIIESNPDILVIVGASTGQNSIFGQPPSAGNGLASLEKILDEPGFQDLTAMRLRRVHAISGPFMRSPLNIVALELFAKWVHPQLFADFDPQVTLDEINTRFLKTPLKGPFWVSLDPAAERGQDKRP